MPLIYRIKLTSSNYPLTPLYKVYYDGNVNNIPTVSNTGLPAENLSYNQLIGGGIQVVVPDGTSNISLTHVDCGTTVSIPISNITYTLYLEMVYDSEPCISSAMPWNIYLGSDGKYYIDQGGTYVLVSSFPTTSTWYHYTGMFNNGIRDIYTYDVYVAINGGFQLSETINSNCAPTLNTIN